MSQTAIGRWKVDLLALSTFSVEQLRETVKGADLEHVQLSSGPFRGHLQRSRFADSVLDGGGYTQDLLVRGGFPENRVTLGYVLEGRRAGYFNGRRLAAHDIVVIAEGAAMEPYQLPADTQWVTFQTRRDSLEREGISLPARGASELYPGPSFWSLQLGHRLRELMTAAQGHGPADMEGKPGDGWVLEDELIATFRRAIDASRGAEPRLHRPHRSKYAPMLRRIEDFIEYNLEREIRVPELCAQIGTSQRALEYLLKDYYGMSPRRYLTTRRLNAVRRCLLQAGPGDQSIARVAARFNFRHPGRFAQTYLDLFGELPSETLSAQKQGL